MILVTTVNKFWKLTAIDGISDRTRICVRMTFAFVHPLFILLNSDSRATSETFTGFHCCTNCTFEYALENGKTTCLPGVSS